MKFKLELALGNEAMLSFADVLQAIDASLTRPGFRNPARPGDRGLLLDLNGNRVGEWEVASDV